MGRGLSECGGSLARRQGEGSTTFPGASGHLIAAVDRCLCLLRRTGSAVWPMSLRYEASLEVLELGGEGLELGPGDPVLPQAGNVVGGENGGAQTRQGGQDPKSSPEEHGNVALPG